MPKIVNIKLIIGGKDFLPKSGYNVSVEQSVGGHSAFRISFPSNATEGYEGIMMNTALNFVGKKASIGLDGNKMEFSGLVTSVDFQKGIGAVGTIVVSGHGPSTLLANSIQCFSYEEGTSLSQVANDTVKGHSKEYLKIKMGRGTKVRLPYTVQYNESDLSFLQRLCSRYGVWFYYNGRELCVGRTGDKQVDGTVGVDVLTFNVSASLREQSFSVKGHDWVNDTLLEAESSAHKPKSSHPYLGQVEDESHLVFGKKGYYDYNVGQHEYSGHGGIETATKVNTLGRSSGMVMASGTSELSDLRVGDTLALEGLKFSDPKKKVSHGSYDIVKVVHRFDHSGQYRNEFEGVPEGTEHPPYSNGFSIPRAGAERGRVRDNADPQGLGRIKVQFPWQKAKGTSTPWIKMATPYSGGGKGFYFIPEKDEEVLVGFEGDNPEKPFVLSAGYNSSAKSGFDDPDNNIKAIKTRSGNQVILNDKNGSITMADPSGNTVIMQGNGEIVIKAPKKLTLVSTDINIQAGNSLNLTAKPGDDDSGSAEGIISITAQKMMKTQVIDETLTFSSKEAISFESTNSEISTKAKTKITLDSDENINLTGKEKVSLNGNSETIISGGEVKINS